MNGAQNDYYIDDPKIGLPLAEHIAKKGGMLAFHIGPDAYEKTHPLRAEKIAKLFPEIPMFLIHMGMTDKNMNEAAIRAAEACENLYLIGSATTDKQLVPAISRLGADRVLFATDYPFRNMNVIQKMYDYGVGEHFNKEEMDMIMFENALKIFNLQMP